MAELRPEVQALLDTYTHAWSTGTPVEPQELLAQVSGDARRELADAIDAFLDDAPRQPFDASAFAASAARAIADDLTEALTGASGAWPVVLPRLRTRAKLRRSELVARLAALLGVSDSEARVGEYYHEMEHGTIDPAGVSDRVLDALGSLVGATREQLRDAAHVLVPEGELAGAPDGPAGAFARTAEPDPAFSAPMSAPASGSPLPEPSPTDREVDQLFLGGA